MKTYLIALISNYAGLGLSMAIQIFLLPFLLGRLGPKLTGLYYVFITISNFVAIGIGWLSGAGIFFLASTDSKEETKAVQDVHWIIFLGFAFYGTFVLLITIVAGLTAGRWWLVDAGRPMIAEGRNACFLLGVYIWLNYLHAADASMFIGILKQGWANFYRIISQLVFIVSVFLLLSKMRLDILMFANCCGAMVSLLAARFHLRMIGRIDRMRWRYPNKTLIKRIFFSKGMPFFLYGLAQMALVYGDVLIIGAFLGSEQVAAFIVIWKIPEVIGLLAGRISEVLSPYLTRIHSRKDDAATALTYLCTSRLQHYIAIVSGIGYGYFGASIVRYWVGDAFQPEQAWVYWIAGIVLAFQIVNKHDVILHYALARLKKIVAVLFVELVLKIILTLVLFKWMGVVAPLAATVIIQFLGLTWVYRYLASQQLKIDWRRWLGQVYIWAGALLVAVGCLVTLLNWLSLYTEKHFILIFLGYVLAVSSVVMVMEKIQKSNGLFELSELLTNA